MNSIHNFVICSVVGLLWIQDVLVRSTALDRLLEAYQEESNVSALHDFTDRFMPRYRELVYDIDEGVAVQGVSGVRDRDYM